MRHLCYLWRPLWLSLRAKATVRLVETPLSQTDKPVASGQVLAVFVANQQQAAAPMYVCVFAHKHVYMNIRTNRSTHPQQTTVPMHVHTHTHTHTHTRPYSRYNKYVIPINHPKHHTHTHTNTHTHTHRHGCGSISIGDMSAHRGINWFIIRLGPRRRKGCAPGWVCEGVKGCR